MSVEHSPNPRAVIGGNFPPEDERAPPKAQRIVTKEDAHVFKVVVRMLATRAELAKWRVLEKRKGGEDGRAVRCFAIGYMRGLGFPVWKLELMWDLNRKQIGQEEEAYIHMRTTREVIDDNLEHVEQMLDSGLRIALDELLEAATEEYQVVLDNRRDAKRGRRVARVEAEEAAAKAPPPPPPAPPSEAEILVLDNQRKRRIEWLEGEVRRQKAVCIAGGQEGAGKDARADAKRALPKLESAMAELNKLKAVKPAKLREALI